jgi:16S rRNA (adenine1518-N6/adenine1519-N6)-dimethyltransferase
MSELSITIPGLLRAFGLSLNKNLGQHFLIDDDVLQTIVQTADIKPGDRIVEIGPGVGVLTRELVSAGGRVTAIELDERFLPILKQYALRDQGEKAGTLDIIHSNALSVPFPTEPYKVVANIPYHITSPLLRHAYLESTPPQTMTLLIQREVAEKICDPEHAGMLTILVRLFGEPTLKGIVKPHAFLPPPEVDSAILHIVSYPQPLADPATIERVFTLTKLGFGQKRKMIRNTIGKMEGGMDLLARAGIDPERRPETLDVEEWIELARRIAQKN